MSDPHTDPFNEPCDESDAPELLGLTDRDVEAVGEVIVLDERCPVCCGVMVSYCRYVDGRGYLTFHACQRFYEGTGEGVEPGCEFQKVM